MHRFKLFLTQLFTVGSLACAIAQAARTPFSAYGYGDTFNDALAHNQGMAGVGISNPQYWYLNNMNPALLVNNRLTVFQAGLLIDKKRVYNDSLRENSSSGNLNYLVLGFPILRNKQTGDTRWGTAIGLMPYTHVNYRFQFADTIPGSGGTRVEFLEEATGGFNEIYWSNGVRINSNLSVGLKTSFLFSSIITNFSNLIDLPNQAIKSLINVHEIQSVKGVKFTPALAYRIDSINNRYVFNFGATYDLGAKLKTNLEQVLERKNASGDIQQSDTLQIENGKANLNQNIGLGVSFGRPERWIVATDLSLMRPGSNFIQIGLDPVRVTNGWRLAFGAELTPDSRSLSSYLKRVTYRAGFSNESGTYLVNGNPVKDFGINFGFSFPVSRYSSLDIAFRTGKRGDNILNGIEENYFKVYFGVTFNDQWFIKRRFD